MIRKKTHKFLVLFGMILSVITLLSSMFVWTQNSHADSADNKVQKEAVFMIGPPAAGKSHTRRELYPKYDVVDPDELKKDAWVLLQKQYQENPNSTAIVNWEEHHLREYANLLQKEYDESNPMMPVITHALSKVLSEEAFKTALTKDNSFVYDTTGVNIEQMKRKIAEAKRHNFKVTVVYVFTSLETCLQRNAERKRSVPVEIVKEIWNETNNAWIQLKDLPTIDEIKQIDTSI